MVDLLKLIENNLNPSFETTTALLFGFTSQNSDSEGDA